MRRASSIPPSCLFSFKRFASFTRKINSSTSSTRMIWIDILLTVAGIKRTSPSNYGKTVQAGFECGKGCYLGLHWVQECSDCSCEACSSPCLIHSSHLSRKYPLDVRKYSIYWSCKAKPWSHPFSCLVCQSLGRPCLFRTCVTAINWICTQDSTSTECTDDTKVPARRT